jgi:hypothetical protein
MRAAPPLPVRSTSTDKKPISRRPPPPSPPKEVHVIQIHSTTATGLPWTFASNQWALKINNTLYLLAVETDTMGSKCRVQFFFTRFEERQFDYTLLDCVGRTKYSVEMLCGLSESAIQSYGTYQSVWWNCQAFLNHYLDLITEGKHKSINTPSSILRTTAFATSFGSSMPSPLPQIKDKWDINENETKVARIATF